MEDINSCARTCVVIDKTRQRHIQRRIWDEPLTLSKCNNIHHPVSHCYNTHYHTRCPLANVCRTHIHTNTLAIGVEQRRQMALYSAPIHSSLAPARSFASYSFANYPPLAYTLFNGFLSNLPRRILLWVHASPFHTRPLRLTNAIHKANAGAACRGVGCKQTQHIAFDLQIALTLATHKGELAMLVESRRLCSGCWRQRFAAH